MNKQCSQCKKIKPLSYYYFSKGKSIAACKDCTKKNSMNYYHKTTKRRTIREECIRRRMLRLPERIKAIQLYEKGLSIRKVSKIIDIPHRTVGCWIKKAGISRNHKDCMPNGQNHWSWKGGKKCKSHHLDSSDYRLWRTSVFERDLWTCLCCHNVGGELEAHHILSWIKYPKERFNLKNGVTLCKECHMMVHGRKIKIA